MELPDGAPSARATSQMTLQPGATISGEENQGKPTYAATVTMANQSANAPRHPRESVIARITTHNGIPAVIFKAKDYYGIMAEECRLTIVGRFLKGYRDGGASNVATKVDSRFQTGRHY
ncbi:hypothetical protein KY290_024427 [Solanum tuberosum]|uniref:Uncharacterized protein n=1 Tax=Solanum tuberosum TaxID=4113 RepID=A0ABQ7UQQ0_SOLTU|nr:hypothetical protein KY290_024427 [Solanum tuberosum]